MLDVQSSRFLASALGQRASRGRMVRMVGKLFGRPESQLGAKEVVPNLEYFHVRSSDYVDFFCAGYGPEDSRDPNRHNQIRVGGVGWRFDADRFNAVRMEVQVRTNWTYSGGRYWRANPTDHDAHLTGPNADPSRFHVFFPPGSRGSLVAPPFAALDLDDVNSFGPELSRSPSSTPASTGTRYTISPTGPRHRAPPSALPAQR